MSLWGFQSESYINTVSAVAKLMPRPPARVESKKQNVCAPAASNKQTKRKGKKNSALVSNNADIKATTFKVEENWRTSQDCANPAFRGKKPRPPALNGRADNVKYFTCRIVLNRRRFQFFILFIQYQKNNTKSYKFACHEKLSLRKTGALHTIHSYSLR